MISIGTGFFFSLCDRHTACVMANDESKAKHLQALEALWARLSETEKAEVLARSDSIEKEQNFCATASIKTEFQHGNTTKRGLSSPQKVSIIPCKVILIKISVIFLTNRKGKVHNSIPKGRKSSAWIMMMNTINPVHLVQLNQLNQLKHLNFPSLRY